MHSRPRFALFFAAAFATLALALCIPALTGQTGDPKQTPDPSKAAGDGKDPQPKKMALDKLKIPPGGVVVLADETKDPRVFFARMVILTPEKYQELVDRISSLEKQIKAERKSPHACNLTATVEADSVRVTAEMAFQTEQPHAAVSIGFRGTQLSEAKIRAAYGGGSETGTWQPAAVEAGPDGYVVQVEKAGDHRMIVEARLPLAGGGRMPAPGIERSFDLGLPGAAVTTLTLDLPLPVKELRWNKTNIEKPSLPAVESKHWQLAIGKAAQLLVAWTEPVTSGGANPLRTAQGLITVRFNETQVVTTAKLTLVDLNGKAKEWRLWLPPLAVVKVESPNVVVATLAKGNPYSHVLNVTPTSDPIKVQITTAAERPAVKFQIGPFAVKDAIRQEGTIEVELPLEARRSSRLMFHLTGGSLEEREPPRDQPGSDAVAIFKYWDMPPPPANTSAGPPKALVPLLEVEPRTIQGKMETHVEHQLRLVPSDQGWQVKALTTITARPLDVPVDFLDIQLPRLPPDAWPPLPLPAPLLGTFPSDIAWANWVNASLVPTDSQWGLTNGGGGVDMTFPNPDAQTQRKARVKWSSPQSKEFVVALESVYTVPSGMHKVRLELPRPLAIHDRGAKGRAEVNPNDAVELLTQDGGPEVAAPEKHRLTRTWDRSPAFWDLAWREYRPEFPMTAITDIAIRPAYAHVREQLNWNPAERPRGQAGKLALLRLRVPDEVKGLKIVGEGKVIAQDREKHVAWVEAPDTQNKGSLVLEYDFGLSRPQGADKASAPVNVPLIWPEQATRMETKVRLWSSAAVLPVLAEPLQEDLTWKDIGTEAVAGRDSLPIRVLRGEGSNLPLALRLERAPTSLAGVVVDRALIQVQVDDEGLEQYRTRFLLTEAHATYVDVRLPLPLTVLSTRFALDGKTVTAQPLDSSGLLARIDLDLGLYGKPVLLEVDYQLPRDQPAPEGLWQTTLNPPGLEGNVFVGKVRWQVTLPSNQMALAARGDAINEQQWRWRGWLPSLEPAVSRNDLELWLTGQESPENAGDASLVCARTLLAPLRISRVSRAAWFLICSGVVLATGLGLYWRSPPPRAWLAILVAGLVTLAAAAWWVPEFMPAVLYGALPGMALLAGLLVVQWFVHERYKRQLVFMPGFTRVKGGSSLLRTSSIQRHPEPSTIDAPAALERSSQGSKLLP
jgi:hypothetical protein